MDCTSQQKIAIHYSPLTKLNHSLISNMISNHGEFIVFVEQKKNSAILSSSGAAPHRTRSHLQPRQTSILPIIINYSQSTYHHKLNVNHLSNDQILENTFNWHFKVTIPSLGRLYLMQLIFTCHRFQDKKCSACQQLQL